MVCFRGGMIEHLMAGENYQLAVHLLDAAALRHEALATNLANVETPGFKRLDLAPDFARELQKVAANPGAADLSALRPKISEDLSTRSVRADGNNVELDRELLELSRNQIEFETLAQFASESLKRLKTAITGRPQ